MEGQGVPYTPAQKQIHHLYGINQENKSEISRVSNGVFNWQHFYENNNLYSLIKLELQCWRV